MKNRKTMKLSTINKPLIILFLICFSFQLKSQTIYHLTLDSAIAIAKEKSYRMRILNEIMLQATYRVKSIKLSYLPSLEFNGIIPSYSEELKQYQENKSGFYYQKDFQFNGELSLNQVLPTNGRLSVVSSAYNNRSYYDTAKLFKTNIEVRYSQPLEAFYAYNYRKAQVKEAKLNYELATKQYKREELNLIYNISNLFYNVVSNQKQKEIAFQNLKRQEEANKMAQNKYETGLIKEVEALQIEVDLGEAINGFDVQTTNLIQAQNNLKMELGLFLTDSLFIESNLSFKEILINPDQAVNLGLTNRTELRESQIQIDLNKLEIKRVRSDGLIKGSLEAKYGINGSNIYKNLSYPYTDGFNSTFDNMFSRPGSFGIALTIKIPILDWGTNHQKVKIQQSRLKQNTIAYDYEKINIENEIRNTIYRFNSSLRRLQLLEKNVKLAEKSFEISYLRFTNGDIDAESLGLDRIRYNTAQQSYLDAYISYKMLLLDLNRKTFFDFENNTSLVPEI